MADPVGVVCTEGQWTKVASNVITGWLRQPALAISFNFWWTSRDSDSVNPIPDDDDSTDDGLAMLLFEKDRNEEMGAVTAQDFYVWIKNADDDDLDTVKIRVDLP